MFFVPLTFIITQLPGSLRRGYQWTGELDQFSSREQEQMARAHAILSPLKALFNMLLLVALDPDLREEYCIYFKDLHVDVGTALGYDMTINKSLMKDDGDKSSNSNHPEVASMSDSTINIELAESTDCNSNSANASST